MDLYAYSRGYLGNHKTKLCQILVHVAYGNDRSFCGSIVIRYVLPVLWMKSCSHIMDPLVVCDDCSNLTIMSQSVLAKRLTGKSVFEVTDFVLSWM